MVFFRLNLFLLLEEKDDVETNALVQSSFSGVVVDVDGGLWNPGTCKWKVQLRL